MTDSPTSNPLLEAADRSPETLMKRLQNAIRSTMLVRDNDLILLLADARHMIDDLVREADEQSSTAEALAQIRQHAHDALTNFGHGGWRAPKVAHDALEKILKLCDVRPVARLR